MAPWEYSFHFLNKSAASHLRNTKDLFRGLLYFIRGSVLASMLKIFEKANRQRQSTLHAFIEVRLAAGIALHTSATISGGYRASE